MAGINPRVLEMVRREVTKNPGVTNEVLRKKAVSIDRSVSRLSPQQFHGTYRLTAARALAAGGRKRRQSPPVPKRRAARPAPERDTRATAATSSSRDQNRERAAVRATLLELAERIAAAETKAQVLGVLGSIDDYVERVVSRVPA